MCVGDDIETLTKSRVNSGWGGGDYHRNGVTVDCLSEAVLGIAFCAYELFLYTRNTRRKNQSYVEKYVKFPYCTKKAFLYKKYRVWDSNRGSTNFQKQLRLTRACNDPTAKNIINDI